MLGSVSVGCRGMTGIVNQVSLLDVVNSSPTQSFPETRFR